MAKVVWKNRGEDHSLDMLPEGSGEHVLRSPDNGGSNHGGNPVSRVQGWHRWGGSLLLGLAHVGELVLVVVDPYWVLSAPDASRH